jgi:phosphoribosylanthranilate isomerase
VIARTRIKICGITRPQDAIAAAEAGADAIGLVFYSPVKRNVSIETARAILDVLPPFVTPVGLFVDASNDRIREIAGELNLRTIQLHGHESGKQIAELQQFAVLKAIRVERDQFQSTLSVWIGEVMAHKLANLRGLTLETAGTKQAGGTGVANDWETVRQSQKNRKFSRVLPPIIAAGGLTPENVAKVVRDIRPYAVDVSSGVESAPGEKSTEKIKAFVQAVHEADSQR